MRQRDLVQMVKSIRMALSLQRQLAQDSSVTIENPVRKLKKSDWRTSPVSTTVAGSPTGKPSANALQTASAEQTCRCRVAAAVSPHTAWRAPGPPVCVAPFGCVSSVVL